MFLGISVFGCNRGYSALNIGGVGVWGVRGGSNLTDRGTLVVDFLPL